MINFPFGQMENLLFLGVSILKHITAWWLVVLVKKNPKVTFAWSVKDGFHR